MAKKTKNKKSTSGAVARRKRQEPEPELPVEVEDELANVPAHVLQDTEVEEMAGLENMEGRDWLIPRLVIMQALSPMVKDREADPGELYNSVTKELILGVDEVTRFVPCFMYKEWIQWNDRGSAELWAARDVNPRGELAMMAQRGDKRQDDRGKEVFIVTEHINFICLLPTIALDMPVTISCARSNWKHGKQLMNLARYRRKPFFAGTYNLEIAEEQNTKGDDYFAYSFTNAGWTEADEYEAGKALWAAVCKSFDAGKLSSDHEGMTGDSDVDPNDVDEDEM